MAFSAGTTVRCRSQRCVVLESQPVSGGEAPSNRLLLKVGDGPLRGQMWPVVDMLEPTLAADELPPLSLGRAGRDARFRLLHDAFQLTLVPPPTALIASSRSRIQFHWYQQIPAMRMLSLPRPRILNASDVGLGKTVETGIALRELIARRRADRILIVCPASITEQWQQEMAEKFGLEFMVFDRDGVHQARKGIDVLDNPWATEPRIIASFDFMKRRDGAFRELQNVRFSVIVCDECHHLADNTLTDDVAERHRLAQWCSRASDALMLLSATPHSGYDQSFASLLNLLEPSLVPSVRDLKYHQYSRHLVRHLKRHIKNPDGSDFFVQPLPSKPIAVRLSPEEMAVHAAVARQAGALDEAADKLKSAQEKYALRLVATVLRKRAASSLAALRATVIHRMENLEQRAEDIEIRRDHLRSLRRGDTISDEALSQLEIDAHRSFLSRIRAAGKRLRTIESETEDLLALQDLLDACPQDSDSKAEALLGELRRIHAERPDDSIIVFSEYVDTVAWLEGYLSDHGYDGQVVRFDGTVPGPKRKQALKDFAEGNKLILLSTDSASEGLNLQGRCHRVIHVELPFNPNRILQRQGRVDRFGQTEVCKFAYLYAADTYEGEVLHRLFEKIERQVRRLGAVGDVLGSLQADRIEDLISRSPADLKAAIQEADQQIERELARVDSDRAHDLMGEGDLPNREMDQLRLAVREGEAIAVSPADFLVRAIGLAGGRCHREGDVLQVPVVPSRWVGGKVKADYDALYLDAGAAPDAAAVDDVIDERHTLVQNAIRWVRESRYSAEDDHRLAARVAELDQADLVATFVATVRAADNTEMERLIAVRIAADGTVDPNDAYSLLIREGLPENVPQNRLPGLFGPWWEEALATAESEARKRAGGWREQVRQRRFAEAGDLKKRLDEWNRVTRDAITHGHEDEASFLPGMAKPVPSAVKRRLRQHEREYDAQRGFLDGRLRFEEPSVEPLGVLLRVPRKEVG
ncbi:helicase-related protein [Verrucomicrobiota bacterium]